jgi:hypothetical protein
LHAHRAQSVGQGRRANQIKGSVDAVRVQLVHGGRDLAGVEQGVVDAMLGQQGKAAGEDVMGLPSSGGSRVGRP